MSEEAARERLYAAAHGDFVGERKAIAAELRAAGETAVARRIIKLTRPPVSVWAVNQLARRAPAVLRAAVDAIDVERDAQLAVLSGGATDALSAAKRESRAALTAARGALEACLEEGGHAPSKSNLDRAQEILRHAVLDAELRDDLEAGVLAAVPEPPDLSAVARQLDPALLRAALQKTPTRARRRGVDSFMAKAVRGRRVRSAVEPEARAGVSEVAATPTTKPRRRTPDPERIAALEAELGTAVAEAEKTATEVETLTAQLDDRREELRRLRRRAGDLKERLQTLKRRAE